MGYIETIKQKINQLDAGSFQNLCDSYLSRIGYQNIVSLGGEAGTRKTTKGTPDTYFILEDGNYIFVEYTTQKTSLFNKMKDDINKCLDEEVTEIPREKISEIIYCHTSSNIRPSQDKALKEICETAGIKLIIIGIDRIAGDIYLHHSILARDFLDIVITTGQIMEYNDFVIEYNLNKLAAPLNTEFLFRKKEIVNITKAFETTDIIVLSGAAGVGKTRLALYYAQEYLLNNNSKLFCVSNKSLPIYEDIKLLLESSGEYILIIDDANQLTELEFLIQYITKKSREFKLKVIITVRDYAKNAVIDKIRRVNSYEIIKVTRFTDEEIKVLLETTSEIMNSQYQDRIITIAEGNARIALLAAEIARNSNRLKSIFDLTQLYDDYFSIYLKDNEILLNKDSLRVAGIVAVLDTIHLEVIDESSLILKAVNITKDNFIESINELHQREIVDLYDNKVVRFSDQCLSNYILKLAFFDEKVLSLSNIVYVCFQSYKEETINSINTLTNIFRNEELIDFVYEEMRGLWERLEIEGDEYFFEFVRAFYSINPTKTLIILRKKIGEEKTIVDRPSMEEIEKGKSNQYINNRMIDILGGFSSMEDLPSALDLFFEYFLKRQDLYLEFYHASNSYFGIDKNSVYSEYRTQIQYLEKIKQYSQEWKIDHVNNLFLDVAEQLLRLEFIAGENGRKRTFVFYNIVLENSHGAREYRRLIWEYLLELSEKSSYKDRIKNIIGSYGRSANKVDLSIIEFDLKYIDILFKKCFPPDILMNCILASELIEELSRRGIDITNRWTEYFDNEPFKTYRVIEGPKTWEYKTYQERLDNQYQGVKDYVSNVEIKDMRKIIDICDQCKDIPEINRYKIRRGLEICLNIIETEVFLKAVDYYLYKNTPLDVCSDMLVNKLFTITTKEKVFSMINNKNFKQKNLWLYSYYHEVPSELIDREQFEGLLSFLKDDNDKDITTSPIRDVGFLEKYDKVDEEAFIKGCEIILIKKSYSAFIPTLYFESLFYFKDKEPKEIIMRFNQEMDLLKDIYFHMVSHSDSFDYNGEVLKEIYLFDRTILDKYIVYLVTENASYTQLNSERLLFLFELDEYIDVINESIEKCIINCKNPVFDVPYFIEKLLLKERDENNLSLRQSEWVKQYIHLFSNDMKKMIYLFSVISLLSKESKKEYMKLFLDNNKEFESFKMIPLRASKKSWWGSIILVFYDEIEFLESLLPLFDGLEWIEHKDYVENLVIDLRKRVKAEELQNFINGDD